MPDHIFEFTGPRKGLYHATQRSALLRALFPKEEIYSKEVCCQRTLDVLTLWRKRVEALKAAGCLRLQKEEDKKSRSQWVRNCPPHYIEREERRGLRSCNITKICPWCWTKAYGSDTYSAIADYLFPGGKPKTQLYRLVAREVTFTSPVGDTLFDLIYYARGYADTVRKARLDRKTVGAFQLTAIYATKKKEWRSSTRFLALIPADQEWKVEGWRVSAPIETKRQVVPFAARFGAYHWGALTGDAGMMAEYLNAKIPLKLKSTFGVFNNRGRNIGDVSTLHEAGED